MISHGKIPIKQFWPRIVLNLEFFWVNTKKLSSDLESLHFANSKSGREMVMENQGMVMEKSWKIILSSLLEP